MAQIFHRRDRSASGQQSASKTLASEGPSVRLAATSSTHYTREAARPQELRQPRLATGCVVRELIEQTRGACQAAERSHGSGQQAVVAGGGGCSARRHHQASVFALGLYTTCTLCTWHAVVVDVPCSACARLRTAAAGRAALLASNLLVQAAKIVWELHSQGKGTAGRAVQTRRRGPPPQRRMSLMTPATGLAKRFMTMQPCRHGAGRWHSIKHDSGLTAALAQRSNVDLKACIVSAATYVFNIADRKQQTSHPALHRLK